MWFRIGREDENLLAARKQFPSTFTHSGMKNIALTAVLFCLAASPLRAEDVQLFRMSAGAGAAAPGDHEMVFQEISRSEDASTIEASHVRGSVAAKSMFLARGSCALMKERKWETAGIERVSKEPVRLIIRSIPAASVRTEDGVRPAGRGKILTASWCEMAERILKR